MLLSIPVAPLKFEAFYQGRFPISATSGWLLVHECLSWSRKNKGRKLLGPLLLFQYSQVKVKGIKLYSRDQLASSSTWNTIQDLLYSPHR
jgi:hypothetical protein